MTRPPALPAISVVIPTYDRARVLGEAIASVLTLARDDIELIVVDDASSDDTPDLLAAISDPRFRWSRFEQRRHAGAARNHGAAMARAPILTFLDSDDLYLPHRLPGDIRFFVENPHVDLRLSSYQDETLSGSYPARNPEVRLTPRQFEKYLICYCLHIGGSAIAIRRSAYEAVGGFDEGVWRMQDREFLLRAARRIGAAVSHEINWVKRRSEDSISHQPAGQLQALAELWRRHPSIRQRYPEIFHYLTAREIIGPLMKGRLGQARSMLLEAYANKGMLDLSLSALVRQYLVGKRFRRQAREELGRQSEGNPKEDAHATG